MLGAATADSRGVTVSYAVTAPDPALSFGVFRSAWPGSTPGRSRSRPRRPPRRWTTRDPLGRHRGSTRSPSRWPAGCRSPRSAPYVLVVADPGPASTAEPQTVASFRKESIAIVTHGGLQHQNWKKNGPPWTLEMARSLRQQGFDMVIPFNWVAASRAPGAAAKRGRVARMILEEAASSRRARRSTSTSSATARGRWSTAWRSARSRRTARTVRAGYLK